ncbi:MAG: GspH/FimT family pseudopilin [Nitrospirota bacterium]
MRAGTQEGFSIVELIIAVAIAAIAGAIAMPAFHNFTENKKLKSAARALESDFFELKERAIAENRQFRLTINVVPNNYTTERCGAVAQSPCAGWEPPTVRDFSAIGTNIAIAGAPNTTETQYTFQTRGTATPGTVRLILTNRPSWAEITTNITGRTYVRFDLQ